jgi:hypothetical protein
MLESRNIWLALATLVLGFGLRGLYDANVAGRPADAPSLGATVAGALMFLILLVPTLPPYTRFMQTRREQQAARDLAHTIDLTDGARYRQRLECLACHHRFYEDVRHTSQGWLEYEGALRKCPSCKSSGGFQSLGSEPLNREARELGRL